MEAVCPCGQVSDNLCSLRSGRVSDITDYVPCLNIHKCTEILSAEARIVLLQGDPEVRGVSGFICRQLDFQGTDHSHSMREAHVKTSGHIGWSARALDWQEC